MKNSTARRLVALGLGAALVLAGCSSSDGEGKDNASPSTQGTPQDTAAMLKSVTALKAIQVEGEPGSAPKLTFDAGLTVSDIAAIVVDKGDGAEMKAGDTASFHSVAYSGTTGEVLEGGDTFGKNPDVLVLTPQATPQALLDVLIGEKVGSRFIFANPVEEGQDAVIVLIEALSTKETRARGESVTPEAGLPTVTLDAVGKPSIDIPKDYATPDGLVTQTLIKGDGPVVEASQSVTAHYTGWKLDGTTFDSSWERGAPSDFPLNGVIEGWTEGLAGQTVGSQVLLVIPTELAYDKGDLAGETLVFVVDILAAS